MSDPIRRLTGGGQAFFCPGCNEVHCVNSHPQGPRWSYNNDPAAPTFSPSILITSGHCDPQYKPGEPCWCGYNDKNPDNPVPFTCGRCHSWVRAGQIQFLPDCTHGLAGKTVPLPPWPHAPGSYGGVEE